MNTCKPEDSLLTPEERYDVYCVKSSERPHLLETFDNNDATSEINHEELPLMDGCDIPRWRAEQLVPCSPYWESALNVGFGCSLLRRERQLPLRPSKCFQTSTRSPWEALQQYLLQQPTSPCVERISCAQASQPLANDNNSNAMKESSIPQRKYFSKWEEQNYPVIVEGATEGWNLETWKFDNLVQRFANVRWRFSDTHGAMMSLATYAKYVASEGLTDDSPLAVYDSEFGEENSPMHELLADYTVPPCFSDDLFGLAVEDDDDEDDDDDNHANSRPPWRWILAGPPRSGTGLHIDPLWTNAWVTLLQGLKRWILIPPHVELPEGAGLREPQVPSVIWFRDYYDKVKQLEGVVEILQKPGETVFVPNGWPHLVLNLEQTVAVTHNYASEFGPFERMWDETVQNEPEFAHRWYKGLCRHRPDLASRIQRNNNSSEA